MVLGSRSPDAKLHGDTPVGLLCSIPAVRSHCGLGIPPHPPANRAQCSARSIGAQNPYVKLTKRAANIKSFSYPGGADGEWCDASKKCIART
jgi:hypothetical protein